MENSKHVVITGSSSGIGYGLAVEFLKIGFSVTISGRNSDKLKGVEENFKSDFPEEKILAEQCDVSDPNQIRNLWDTTYERFGKIDIWINNAGIGQEYDFLYNIDEDKINDLIDINLKGVIFATRTVFLNMQKQGFGSIYNMEGFGSDGRKMAKLILYGTTKSAVTYFTKSFVKETKGKNVNIGLISPGMVITDLFLKPEYKDEKEAKSFLKVANILADKVETVTPWLVKKIAENKNHGKSFNWLSNRKAIIRFLFSNFKKRSLISKTDINILN